MSRKLLYSILALCIVRLPAQTPESAPCAVTNAHDFQYGIANVDECSVLELQNSIALTPTSFATDSFTITNRNLTIQSSPAAAVSETICDFGSYELNIKIIVTGSSTVTFHNLTLQNYASTSVQNGTTSTFMELFSFDSMSSLLTNNVQYLIGAQRCLLDKNYTTELATPRTSWLQSLGLQELQGGLSPNGTYYVQHAVAPLTFTRANLTTTLPAHDTATVTFNDCSFSCPTTNESAPLYQVVSRVWSPLELLSSLKLPDSRSILLQQSLTTANGSWGTVPLLIAESRVVYISGMDNITLLDQEDAANGVGNISNAVAAVVLPSGPEPGPESEPESFFTWTINDNTDLLQVGYLGALTIQALTLKLPQPCCVLISLVGSWYFSNQPLPWNIFGTIMPGAFSVQAVQVPQLNAPAYFLLRSVNLEYASCDASFAAAAELLVSKANAEYDTGSNVVSFVNQTLYCNPCLFQGSEQVPSVYSNAVSEVLLYDTNITCLDVGGSTAAANANGTVQNSTTVGQQVPPIATAGAAWVPPVWLPVLLAIVTCVLVGLGLTAVWQRIRK